MTRWEFTVPDDADRSVRLLLARMGLPEGDLPAFVVDACRREVLRRTVQEVQRGNAQLTYEEAMRLASDALTATRATRS
jgi:hypothetical protein